MEIVGQTDVTFYNTFILICSKNGARPVLSTSELQEVWYSRMSGCAVDAICPCEDHVLLGVADISGDKRWCQGGGGCWGRHSSPALSRSKADCAAEHVEMTIYDILTRVYWQNCGGVMKACVVAVYCPVGHRCRTALKLVLITLLLSIERYWPATACLVALSLVMLFNYARVLKNKQWRILTRMRSLAEGYAILYWVVPLDLNYGVGSATGNKST